jgi:hypothetical protein
MQSAIHPPAFASTQCVDAPMPIRFLFHGPVRFGINGGGRYSRKNSLVKLFRCPKTCLIMGCECPKTVIFMSPVDKSFSRETCPAIAEIWPHAHENMTPVSTRGGLSLIRGTNGCNEVAVFPLFRHADRGEQLDMTCG